MASQYDNQFASYPSSTSNLFAFQVVDLQADGTMVLAGGTNRGVGVLQEDCPASLTGFPVYYGRVKLWNAMGTYDIISSGVPTVIGTSYGITAGQVAAVGVGVTAFLKAASTGDGGTGTVSEFFEL